MTEAVTISIEDASSVEAIMPVMESAFDPAFGEGWTAGQCLGMMTIPGSYLFVARQEKEITGFALSRGVLDEAELLLIATTPAQRRKGVGHLLAQAVIDHHRQHGTKSVFLEVRENNPALALYLNVGFIQVGFRESYYRGKTGEYFNALTLRYEIAP